MNSGFAQLQDFDMSFLDKLPTFLVSLMAILLLCWIFRKHGKDFNITKVSLGPLDVSSKPIPVERIQFILEPSFDLGTTPVRLKDTTLIVVAADGKPLNDRVVTVSSKGLSNEELLQGCLEATTDSNGRATFSGITLIKGGSIHIIAECEGKQTSTKTYRVPSFSDPVDHLCFSRHPVTCSAAPEVMEEVVVEAYSSSNQLLLGKSVTLSAIDANQQPVVLNGTTNRRTDVEGCAYYTDLSIEKLGSYRIIAQCEDIKCVSSIFEVVDAKVSRITFMDPPPKTVVRNCAMSEIVIKIRNKEGEGLAGKAVTIAVNDNRKRQLLVGTTTKDTDENGLVSFPDLAISRTGIHRIIVECEDVRTESPSITVTPPGTDMDLSHYAFGSPEYQQALLFKIRMNHNNASVSYNGEELQ